MSSEVSRAASTEASDREIVLSRTYAAPRELVFEAWIDPVHVAEWWGPEGFTTTILEMDPRPGGTWRFIMHGPDGVDYPNRIDYLEIRRPERLVYTHRSDEEPPQIQFEATLNFTERGGQTELNLRMLFRTAAERDLVVEQYGAIEGGIQHLQRLADYLAKM
jgi:uncharacterized protein YndB with AHSA1/START domain